MTVAAAVVNVRKIMLLRGERGNLLSTKQTRVSVRLSIAALAAIKARRASDINFVDAVISCVR